jgi:hypothetical protein
MMLSLISFVVSFEPESIIKPFVTFCTFCETIEPFSEGGFDCVLEEDEERRSLFLSKNERVEGLF